MAVAAVPATGGVLWSALGQGVNGAVTCLAVYDGELIAGGVFDSPAGNLARWDGTAWQAPGSGTEGYVFAVEPFQGSLYAGGWFMVAGGKPSTLIGSWTDGVSGSPERDAAVAKIELRPAFPNPFRISVHFRYVIPASGRVTLSLWDPAGRRVATLFEADQEAGAHDLFWDGLLPSGRSAARGVYVYRIERTSSAWRRRPIRTASRSPCATPAETATR